MTLTGEHAQSRWQIINRSLFNQDGLSARISYLQLKINYPATVPVRKGIYQTSLPITIPQTKAFETDC